MPSDDALHEALKKTGCAHLRVTDEDELVKDSPDLQLNLSAIAKGFGSDRNGPVLRSHNLTNFYVAISGETVTSGLSARREKWRWESPPGVRWRAGDPLVGVVPLSDQALSTSGDYQKFFVDAQGHRWSHIFDPRSGKPSNTTWGASQWWPATARWPMPSPRRCLSLARRKA